MSNQGGGVGCHKRSGELDGNVADGENGRHMPKRILLISCQGPEGRLQVAGEECDHELP